MKNGELWFEVTKRSLILMARMVSNIIGPTSERNGNCFQKMHMVAVRLWFGPGLVRMGPWILCLLTADSIQLAIGKSLITIFYWRPLKSLVRIGYSNKITPAFIPRGPFWKGFRIDGINIMKWPARSPDLNTIEKLWEILVCRVYANGRPFNNVRDLEKTIREEWSKISADIRHNLINNIPDRSLMVFDGLQCYFEK